MTAPVYSSRFLRTSLVTTTVVYTVPAGHRAVLCSVAATNGASVGSTHYVQLAGVYVVVLVLPGGSSAQRAETRQVAYAGETITGYIMGEVGALCCSGYLFLDPAGAQGDHDGVPDLSLPPPPPLT